jgi:hypothetical protein
VAVSCKVKNALCGSAIFSPFPRLKVAGMPLKQAG